LRVSTFALKVYELVSQVPAGRVTTYGTLAAQLGNPLESRAVGAALRVNPHPVTVPCHRVVKATGELGGYGGEDKGGRKAALLLGEGVAVKSGRVDLSRYLFSWE